MQEGIVGKTLPAEIYVLKMIPGSILDQVKSRSLP